MNGVQENNIRYRDKINKCINGKSEEIKSFVYFLNDLALSTRYAYVNDVIHFMGYVKKEERELCLNDFLRYMTKIQYADNGNETTSSYRIAVYSALKKFSKYLFVSGTIKEDYMSNIDRPKQKEMQKTIQKRKIGYLNQDEMKIYLDNIEHDNTTSNRNTGKEWAIRNSAIIKIFLSTGIRCSALMMLDLENVDLEKCLLYVTDKGGKVSEYPLSKSVMKNLIDWLECRRKLEVANNALFVTRLKKRMSNNAISDVVKKYTVNINQKNITPHKLRATYGTILYNKTKDIYFVQGCMNHSSASTTALYIRDEDDQSKMEAASIIGNLF